jgi:molybdate transport system substrate-binding protein
MAIASSLREFSDILLRQLLEQDPRVIVEPVFGASSAHARQLSLGAPIDVFVSADAAIVDDLIARGLLVSNSTLEFATGQLTLVARASWPTSLASDPVGGAPFAPDDLTRIAIPSAAVPLGRYARAWLSDQGLLSGLAGKIVETEHARATLAAVDAGLVDVAIVYRSDLRLAKRARTLRQLDPSEYPRIRYVAARTQRAPDCQSIERALAAWGDALLQDELGRAGFIPTYARTDP